MKIIRSSKYRQNQEKKVLCFEIRYVHPEYHNILMYLDRYRQLCVGEIKVKEYRINEDQSQITLFDLNDEIFGVLKYRIIFDMEN